MESERDLRYSPLRNEVLCVIPKRFINRISERYSVNLKGRFAATFRLIEDDDGPIIQLLKFIPRSQKRPGDAQPHIPLAPTPPPENLTQVPETQPTVVLVCASPRDSQGIGYVEKDTNRIPPKWWLDEYRQHTINPPPPNEQGSTYYNPNRVGPSGPKKSDKAWRQLGYDSLTPLPRGPRWKKERRWFFGRALTEDEAKKEGKNWADGLDYQTQKPIET
jgi:hypothetical protein